MLTFHGKKIAYQGVEFEGSPCHVFWDRFIEPFIEDLSIKEIDAAVALARERRVDLTQLFAEVQQLLHEGIERVYSEMADVDRRLRGKGYLQHIQPRAVKGKIQAMNVFVTERIQSELAMWQPPSRLEEFYANKKFIIWAVGILVGLAGIVAKFF